MRYFLIILLTILYLYLPAQQSTFLRATTAATSGGGSTTGILDSYTGAEAAYATALLYSGYSGSCLRVRRDSDDAEQDIGFSGQDIDEAAINSFCSGTNCFVNTWYDQSGSGNDATQTTTGLQPKIYDSSTGIIYQNSIPAIDFLDETWTRLVHATASTYSQPNHFFTVSYYAGGNTEYAKFIIGTGNGPASGRNDIAFTLTNNQVLVGFAGVVDNVGSTYTTANQFLISALFNSPSSNIYANGSLDGSGNAGTYPINTRIVIGDYNNSTDSRYSWNSTIQVIVFYSSDQSANRTGIESAINSYYNIFYINILILLVRLPKRKEKNAA